MEYLDNDGLKGRMGNSGGRQFYQRIIGGLYPVLDPLLQLLQKIVDKGLDLHRLEATGGVKGIELGGDRKSTRLNSSHVRISYAVFCLKKKKKKKKNKNTDKKKKKIKKHKKKKNK